MPGGGPSILVTGANGLLGRATLAQVGSSRPVYALVREPPPSPLPGAPLVIVHDLRAAPLAGLPDRVDTVIHLAQSPRYREFPEAAADVFEVAVASTQRLLDWASRHEVKRFIFAASGGLYGHGEEPFDEDAPVDAAGALGHYLACKRCGEMLTESYGGRMAVVSLRFFFVYGPGQRRTMLIPSLLDRVIHDLPVALHGEDGARINPIYVGDAASAIEAATRLEGRHVINVAGLETLTLRQVVTLMGELTGRRPRIEVVAGAAPRHLVGSTRRMTRLLGAPTTRMAEGLRRLTDVPGAPDPWTSRP